MPSSVISNMRYDPLKEILRIVFVSGLVYDYMDVPVEIYNAMRKSKSKGSFLNKFIKNNFSFKQVREGEESAEEQHD